MPFRCVFLFLNEKFSGQERARERGREGGREGGRERGFYSDEISKYCQLTSIRLVRGAPGIYGVGERERERGRET